MGMLNCESVLHSAKRSLFLSGKYDDEGMRVLTLRICGKEGFRDCFEGAGIGLLRLRFHRCTALSNFSTRM